MISNPAMPRAATGDAEHVRDASHAVNRLAASTSEPLAAVAGFYLSFRLIFVLLASRVFFRDAQDGVVASLTLNYVLLAVVAFASVGQARLPFRSIVRLPCYPGVLLFLAFTGLSLIWSVTASLPAAAAFWGAMVADAAIVVLLLRSGEVHSVAHSLMRGYVWGACAIAVIAWLLPAQTDLRLGDEELLGPNQIGWVCAFAFFLAQYLMRVKSGNWMVQAGLLSITLLRSLSKTTIIAFAVAQVYILLRDRSMSRSKKLFFTASALAVLAIFWSLLASYYDVYTNAGNQAETMTGRFSIWLYIANEAIDKPWLGHGFHSVWKVIPPFDQDFEARHAHNELLQQFYAYGVAGIGMLIGIYSNVYHQVRKLGDEPSKIFFIGFLLFIVVRGFADTEAFDLSLPMWMIVIIGALLHESRRNREAVA